MTANFNRLQATHVHQLVQPLLDSVVNKDANLISVNIRINYFSLYAQAFREAIATRLYVQYREQLCFEHSALMGFPMPAIALSAKQLQLLPCIAAVGDCNTTARFLSSP